MTNIKRTTVSLIFAAAACAAAAAPGEEATGKVLYRAYCAQCHGLEGDGFGVNSYDIEVAPRDHTDTAEMAARTDEELFKVIKHGGKSINKSILMPSWEANLTDEEINLLVDHLRGLCCKGGE